MTRATYCSSWGLLQRLRRAALPPVASPLLPRWDQSYRHPTFVSSVGTFEDREVHYERTVHPDHYGGDDIRVRVLSLCFQTQLSLSTNFTEPIIETAVVSLHCPCKAAFNGSF
jgi:hypothetical protein